MHLYVYTRQTCTHCDPSAHKAPRLTQARPSLLCFPATSLRQQGNMMEAFIAPVTRRRPPRLRSSARNPIRSRNLLTARLRNALMMSLAWLPPPKGRHRCRQQLHGGTAPRTIFFPLEKTAECREGEKVGSLSLGGRCFSETGWIKGEILIPDSFSTSCCASPLYCSKGPW